MLKSKILYPLPQTNSLFIEFPAMAPSNQTEINEIQVNSNHKISQNIIIQLFYPIFNFISYGNQYDKK